MADRMERARFEVAKLVRIASLVVTFLLAVESGSHAQDQTDEVGEVDYVFGDAIICRGRSSALEVCTPMKKGDKIYRGDRITTNGPESRAQLRMTDESPGSAEAGPTIINMSRDTKLDLKRFLEDDAERRNRKPGILERMQETSDSWYDLLKGKMKIYLKEGVLPYDGINVRTGTTICGVAGGTDNITEYNPGADTSVIAVQAGLAVCLADNGDERQIGAMQMATAANGGFGSILSIDQAQWDVKVAAIQGGLGSENYLTTDTASATSEDIVSSRVGKTPADAWIDLLDDPWYRRLLALRGSTIGDLTWRDIGPPNIVVAEEAPAFYVLVVEMSGSGYDFGRPRGSDSVAEVTGFKVRGSARFSMVVRRGEDPIQMLRERREVLRHIPDCESRGMDSSGHNTPPQTWVSGPQFTILDAGPYEGLGQLDAAVQDGLVPRLESNWEHMLDDLVTREVAVCDD